MKLTLATNQGRRFDSPEFYSPAEKDTWLIKHKLMGSYLTFIGKNVNKVPANRYLIIVSKEN